MNQQNFKHHAKYYFPHHLIFYPLLLVGLIYCGRQAANNTDNRLWLTMIFALVMIGWTAFMLRQHYALGNQDRIIRLEMRFRYFVLTNSRFETIEPSLSFRQIAALRFASDAELPELVNRAVSEHLEPTQIKKSIQQWQPDHMRV